MMKIHTTNYQNTLILMADDCPTAIAQVPPIKGETKTVANLQYDMLSKNPYRFDSDEVLFQVFALKNDLSESELEAARTQFFSKGQPCFRASPLTKRYGWGIHNDENGKIALVASESKEYQQHIDNQSIKCVKAMKSSK
jgi:Family of unknown function (DUF6157)